jgi:hypothetical protein
MTAVDNLNLKMNSTPQPRTLNSSAPQQLGYLRSDEKHPPSLPRENLSDSRYISPTRQLRGNYTKQPNLLLMAEDCENSREELSRGVAGISTISHHNNGGSKEHSGILSDTNGGAGGVRKTMMLIVRNNESLDEGFSSVGQSQDVPELEGVPGGGTGNIMEDEMLLTRTEAGLSFQFGSNVCSTQRSIIIPSQVSGVPGEFEKRINDIKAKLTQIKNSINIETEAPSQ